MYVARKKFHRTGRGKAIIISILVFIAIVFAIVAIGANIWYNSQLKPVNSSQTLISVKIPSGQLPKTTAADLQEKEVIKSSQAFLWYLRNNGLTGSIQAGEYELDSSRTTPEIAEMITSGKVSTKSITILPGKRIDQIRQTFIDSGFTAEQVDRALDPALYKNHPALVAKPTDQSLEGYLFPETFKVDSATQPEQIVRQSLDQMSEVLTPNIISDFQKQGFGIHQAITLASVVEKEAGSDAEKNNIAGVFVNRLKKGMMLQSDPTYQYAAFLLGSQPSPEVNSPYNTYKVVGLPPGPISNVTKTSLRAVANPTQHEYLYFVASDDGATRFSKTLEEHNAAIKQYCIKKCSTY
ncbi:endolytic transglycosylase MltG [Candidatus Saccharibacteria bacterium]|nr:endolytic transglycosylase MltG [Candidatus Saccharibacteria bacterium]